MSYYLLIIASTCAPPHNAVKLATLLGLAALPAREACPRADQLEAGAREAGAGTRRRRGAELNTEERDRSTKLRARGARATAKATTNQRIQTGRLGADQSNQQLDRAEEYSGGSGGPGDIPWW